jgi:FKBP-type peptidyl-prolyl cis-trans isomerase FkpA
MPINRVLVLCAAVLFSAFAACSGSGDGTAADTADTAGVMPAPPPMPTGDMTQVDTVFAPALSVNLARMTRRPSGLYVRDRRVGTGAAADSGKWITVEYTGWLADGTVLDDSRQRDKDHRVLLGYGRVLPGWEEGLRGMREGGRRILVIPPALGYGPAGRWPSVPRAATLVFDVELIQVH